MQHNVRHVTHVAPSARYKFFHNKKLYIRHVPYVTLTSLKDLVYIHASSVYNASCNFINKLYGSKRYRHMYVLCVQYFFLL